MNKLEINKEELISYLEEHTKKEAANYFGISEVTINRRLKKWNLTKGRKKIAASVVREIRKLYDQDTYTQEKLAEIYGISRKSVNEIINFKSRLEVGDFGTHGAAEVSFMIKAEVCLSEIKMAQSIKSSDPTP